MGAEILELFKAPVTTAKKRAEEKNIKKEAIIALVLAVLIGLTTILTTYISINKAIKATYKTYKKYSEEYSYLNITKEEYKKEVKEAKKYAFKSIKFTKMFFETTGIALVAICLVAGMMYVISRLVKSPLDYITLLSMSNSAFIIYFGGIILNIIFSFIYTPIGLILQTAAFIYAICTLANTFKESIEVEDTDKLVLFTTIVITVVIAVLALIAYKYVSGLFSSLL